MGSFSVALVDHDTQYEEDAMNLDNFWFYRRLTDEIPDVRLACQTACVLLHCSEELCRDVSLSSCLTNRSLEGTTSKNAEDLH